MKAAAPHLIPGPTPELRGSARGGVINLAGAVISSALGFLLVLVIARTLHASGAGPFFEATALFLICGSVALFGADTGLIRFIAQDRGLHRRPPVGQYLVAALVPVVAIATLLAIGMFVAGDRLAVLLSGSAPSGHVEQLASYLRTLAPFLPLFAVYLLILAATRGYGTMVPNNVIDKIFRPAAQPVFILAAILAGLGTVAVGFAWALPALIGLVPAVLWIRRIAGRADASTCESGPPRPTRELWGSLWRFSAPRGLGGILQSGLNRLDILLLGMLASATEAGIYAAVTRYFVAGRLLTVAISQGMQPTLGMQFARRDRMSAAELYRISTMWIVLISWPLYISMALFAPLLTRLFGRGFASGAGVLVILAAAQLFSTACGSVDVVLLMAGRSVWSLGNTALALTINVSLNLVLIPSMGITGAAISWAIAIVASNVAPVIQLWTAFRLHPFSTGLRDAMLASALCFGGIGLEVRSALGGNAVALATFLLVAVSSYAVVLWLLRDRLQLELLRGLLRFRTLPAPERSPA